MTRRARDIVGREIDTILDRIAERPPVQALSVRLVEIILDPLNGHRPHTVLVHLEPAKSGPLFYAYATRAGAEAKANRFYHGELLELASHPKEPPL